MQVRTVLSINKASGVNINRFDIKPKANDVSNGIPGGTLASGGVAETTIGGGGGGGSGQPPTLGR